MNNPFLSIPAKAKIQFHLKPQSRNSKTRFATGHAKMGKTQKVGSLGEELVVRFLMKRGYTILDRNYWKPWGELDVVAQKKNKIHFVEVKALSRSVSDETSTVVKNREEESGEFVSSETQRKKSLAYIRQNVPKDWFRPEDTVGPDKMKRLGRIIQTYLNAKHVSDETKWQFDVATVLIDSETKRAKINLIEDLTL